MSLVSAYAGDFGLAEQQAVRRRQNTGIANTQAAFLGQRRGARNLADITKRYQQGYQPLVAGYGQRGLGGPNVQSGIQRAGLERYAASLQESLGAETGSLNDELNRIAMSEANSQSELEDYLAQLRLEKQNSIIAAATQLRQNTSY